jgi:hypothetical protein
VASDASGDFVVAWISDGSAESDTSSMSVQAQRLDAGGVPVGGQFQVNSYVTGTQSSPAVAVDAAGKFAIAWISEFSGGTDTDGDSIQAQRYDASAVALGTQFQVNSYTTGYQSVPAVAATGPGAFVVLWPSSRGAGSDATSYSVQGQRYDALGMPAGAQFQVNTYTTSTQGDAAAAADAAPASRRSAMTPAGTPSAPSSR